MKALIGRKLGMTQIINEDGRAVAITLIQAGPCTVTQIRDLEKDGYEAVQLGFETAKKPGKAILGHLKPSGATSKILREFRGTDEELTVGSNLDVTKFEQGEPVKVTGTSKGKGFAGNVKRHNFSRGPKTHGSQNYRRPGSIGSMYPQKVFKGKRMAGQMGHEQVTVKNLTVAYVNSEQNLLGISGAVPGPRKGIVFIEGLK